VVALNDLLGVPIRFLPGNTNTNNATTMLTINIDTSGSLTATTLNRKTPNVGLQILSGGELQSGVMTAAVTFTPIPAALSAIDIELVGNSGSGSAAVYLSQTLVGSATGLGHSGWSGVTQVQFLVGPSSAIYVSEIICDASPHIGDGLITYPIGAASSVNTGWTGNVSSVDEIVYNDSSFVYTATSGAISTYYASGFSLGTNNVTAVCVGCRSKINSGSGPQHLKVAIRTAGSNYLGSAVALGVGYQAVCNVWTTDPATSSAWTAVNAAALEVGMEATT
jgi:hypothetical protein